MNETVKSDWTAVMRMFNDQFEHRYSLDSGDPVLFSEAFFSLATIMAFLRVLQVRSDDSQWALTRYELKKIPSGSDLYE